MIIAAIPARAGSKSIPDKNIVGINGKAALAYSIETALEVPEIDRVVVTTDSYDYISIAEMYGAEVILRPYYLCEDDSTDLDWLKHFREAVSNCGQGDTIVILRPTTPLRRVEVVNEAIRQFSADEGIRPFRTDEGEEPDSLRSVHEMSESAWKCFELEEDGIYLRPLNSYEDCNLPRQEVRPTYHPNGYVDIIHASNLYNDTVYGTNILAYITSRVTEIDSPEDLEYIRWEVTNKEEVKIGLSDTQVSKESLKILSDELKAVNKMEGR